MASAIPQRPLSRPPPPVAPPPSGPLPALPIAKTRKSVVDPFDALVSRPSSSGSTTGIKPLSRAVTASSLPTPRPVHTQSTPAVPTLNTTNLPSSTSTASSSPASALPTPSKTIRKTSSIPSLPRVTTRPNGLPTSPLATSTTDLVGLGISTPGSAMAKRHRSSDIGIKRVKARTSNSTPQVRQSLGPSSMFGGASPSLLNGTGDGILVSNDRAARGSDSFLSVPSRPHSGTSSPNGSYMTDATQFEDVEEEPSAQTRSRSQETAKESPKEKDSDNKGNVLVSVRVRPDANGGEGGKADGEWLVDGRRSLIAFNGREGGDYRYDHVFSPHDQNARVYDAAAKRLVRRVMEGYHGTVFAYGMTGTGKTFSMQGTAQSPGVIPLAITDIFSYIRENPNREFLLRVSYLEIYNEKIHDLLSQSTPGVVEDQDIKLREDPKRGVYATPLKEEIVQSPNQLLRVIARGDLARRTAGTQYNARSSRSHAVVQIVVESRERTPARSNGKILPGGVLVSTLSLIDLAGSERAAENKERRTEGAHINKSLLTLGTVIARLSGEDDKEKEDGTKATEKDKETGGVRHLPYRDSKLTRLLQPALSGNSLVSILCTIQISSVGTSAATTGQHTGETLNTLKFASRAKNNIVSHAKRNESHPGVDAGSRALLDRYRLEIQELRTQLEQQNKAKDEADERDELERDMQVEKELERQEKERHEEQMLEMQLARTALKERITHLNRLILSSRSLGVNSDSGRLSSMSVPIHRLSAVSTNEFGRPVSMRSRDSSNSIESPTNGGDGHAGNERQRGSVEPTGVPSATPMVTEEPGITEEDEVEDSGGVDGTSEASLAQQNQMLQADIADKNRYIATLEKRLLQARRTSRSRVSMALASRGSQQDEGRPASGDSEALLRDKDREIDELKAKLDDQMRMVTALRSAARKRDLLDSQRSPSAEQTPSPPLTAHHSLPNGIPVVRRSSSRLSNHTIGIRSHRASADTHLTNGAGAHASYSSTATSRSSSNGLPGTAPLSSKTPLSPMAILSPSGSDKSAEDGFRSPRESLRMAAGNKAFRRRSVDEMTILLDAMIQDKVDGGHMLRSDKGSLRLKRDTVMGGAEEGIQEETEEEETSE